MFDTNTITIPKREMNTNLPAFVVKIQLKSFSIVFIVLLFIYAKLVNKIK